MINLKARRPLLLCLLTLSSIYSLAGPPPKKSPVRGSSQNGTDNGAPFWNLLGPTTPLTRAGGTVTVSQQVVCTNQVVASAVDAVAALSDPNVSVADAGSCADGAYTFLFQIQSTATNVKATIHDLVGFTPVEADPVSSYGIETCDTDQNTFELCTDPAAPEIAGVTTLVNKANTTIKFVIPKFPAGPPGLGNRGQGMTLVVLTQQAAPLPVSYPRISFK